MCVSELSCILSYYGSGVCGGVAATERIDAPLIQSVLVEAISVRMHEFFGVPFFSRALQNYIERGCYPDQHEPATLENISIAQRRILFVSVSQHSIFVPFISFGDSQFVFSECLSLIL